MAVDCSTATLFEGSVAFLASHHGFADSPVAILRHPFRDSNAKTLTHHLTFSR
jgi:hypothetical protein